MGKTIAQLKREIVQQRKRIDKETVLSEKIAEQNKLSRQLFELKNRKLIGAGAKAKRLSKAFGRGILRAGKKIAPVVQKQAKLIRDQQLRDDAIARKRAKKSGLTKKTKFKFVKVKGKGKKARFKRVKSVVKIPKKKPINKQPSDNIFGNLDF